MQSYASPADPACLDAMHEALERLWAEVPDVDESQRIRFAIALSEVVGNVVAHGRTLDGGTPNLTVRVSAGPDRLHADVFDDGVALSRRITRSMPDDELAENGRGLALAREAVDELRYAREDGGNRWALVLRRAD
jgi:serine/threonine-protein kinase RsbW